MIYKILLYIRLILDKIQIREIFYTILYMAILSIIVGFVIYLIQELLDKKISPKWKLTMWILFIISLTVPFNISNEYESNNLILSTLKPIQEISFEKEVEDKKAEYENYIQKEDTTFSEYKIVRGNLYIAYGKYIIFDILLPCIWAVGVLLIFIKRIISAIAINIKLKYKNVESQRLVKILEHCKKEINVKKKIQIVNLNKVNSPSIYGIIKTKILVNENELTTKTDNEIRYMFLHELAHKKGGDLILNFILNIIKTVYWFNPFTYIFFKRIRQDIELKADSIALKNLKEEENKQYAMTIINELASRVYKSYEVEVLQLVGIERGIERRIYMIKYFPQFQQKTIRITIISLFLICIIGTIFFVGQYIKVENNIFSFDYENVIPYQTKYVGDYQKVKTLTKKLSMGSYAKVIEVKKEEEKYYLYVEYLTYDKNNEQFYNKIERLSEQEKEIILKKNAVALLSLIDNLDGVELTVEKEKDEIIYCKKRYSRTDLEDEYAVDLRTYRYNPQQFPYR